ncbi:MAG TPA: biotin/lipoyl-binding protein, partial [Flavitalea sp.]|nr:biotin/lipoyl-binding protein [Flavitalea sp.]
MRATIFFICALFLAVLTSCKQSGGKQEPKKAQMDSVTVFTLKKEPVAKQVNFPAELTSLERAEIFAKVSGYIKSVKADIGDRVQKGQVLAILEAPEFSSDYSQANANAQTAYSEFAGSLDTYKRILNASKVDGTIAASELEKAKSQMMA